MVGADSRLRLPYEAFEGTSEGGSPRVIPVDVADVETSVQCPGGGDVYRHLTC